MRPSIVLGIALALLLALTLIGWKLHTRTEGTVATTTPHAVQLPRDSGAAVVLTDRSGRVITVPDFTYGHPSVEVEDTGITYVYLTQSDDLVEHDPRYGIVYGSDHSFTIGLLSGSPKETRAAAEAKLRELVPLPDAILCTLKLAVRAADTIEPRLAGKELGLSFCPNAVPLP